MRSVSSRYITAYVKSNIGIFHSKRLESLNGLQLPSLLRRKNPYLFKSKNSWALISNDDEFYTRIIKPLGHDAKRWNDEFAAKYSAVINQFSQQFTARFCDAQGSIDWHRLVAFSSAKSIQPT